MHSPYNESIVSPQTETWYLSLKKWMIRKFKMLLYIILYSYLGFFFPLKIKCNNIWFYWLSFTFQVPWSVLQNIETQVGLFNGCVRKSTVCLVKGWMCSAYLLWCDVHWPHAEFNCRQSFARAGLLSSQGKGYSWSTSGTSALTSQISLAQVIVWSTN